MCARHACFPNPVGGSRNLGECGLVMFAGHYTPESKSLGEVSSQPNESNMRGHSRDPWPFYVFSMPS